MAEVLRECELCLSNITRRIKAAEDEKKRSRMTSMSLGSSQQQQPDDSSSEINLSTIRPYNQRIELDPNEGKR